MYIRRFSLLGLAAWTLLAQDGAAIYKSRCSSCHDAASPEARVPPLSALRAMSPPQIMQSLESGSMKTQGQGLTIPEKYALVTYLAAPAPKTTVVPPSAFCSGEAPKSGTNARGASWSGWGANPANTRFQDAASAGLDASAVPKLKLKWAFGLGDQTVARSEPAVFGGKVFVGSQSGAVYALDARTGCVYWTFAADKGVRSGIVAGGSAVYLGDEQANAYAVDASNGKVLWKVRVNEHFAALITGTPLLHTGVLYVPAASYEEVLPASPAYECCTFRGKVTALDAATGKRLWMTYTIAEDSRPTKKNKAGAQMHGPSGAAVWSSPTFDEKSGALYVATGDNYSDPPTDTSDAVLALDAKSGKLLWSKQLTSGDAFNNSCGMPTKVNCPEKAGSDFDFGQPPILVALANGKRALVIGQKSGMAYALDPDREGEVLWQTRAGKGGFLGGIQWGSAADRERMYVAVSDLQMSFAADPASPQGYRVDLDPKQGGGLFALRLENGEKVWSAKPPDCGERKHCSPAQSAAVTAIPGVVFSGSVDGHLRAYSASTGEVMWDVNTARDYETANGQKARGGSIDCAGPVVAGGMLYVNSGYGQWGGMPGNVLLAFSVEGK